MTSYPGFLEQQQKNGEGSLLWIPLRNCNWLTASSKKVLLTQEITKQLKDFFLETVHHQNDTYIWAQSAPNIKAIVLKTSCDRNMTYEMESLPST